MIFFKNIQNRSDHGLIFSHIFKQFLRSENFSLKSAYTVHNINLLNSVEQVNKLIKLRIDD